MQENKPINTETRPDSINFREEFEVSIVQSIPPIHPSISSKYYLPEQVWTTERGESLMEESNQSHLFTKLEKLAAEFNKGASTDVKTKITSKVPDQTLTLNPWSNVTKQKTV